MEQGAQRSHVVVTTLGSDRPGIVDELSEWILEYGGNIEESRMAVLGSEFATLILVTGDGDLHGRLEATREEFAGAHGLTVYAKPVSAQAPAPSAPLLRYVLRATSLDHPGVVKRVARLLREQSVNIVSADTHTSSAPFTGAVVFHFQMVIDVPSTVPICHFREQLRDLGRHENIDFMLAPHTAG